MLLIGIGAVALVVVLAVASSQPGGLGDLFDGAGFAPDFGAVGRPTATDIRELTAAALAVIDEVERAAVEAARRGRKLGRNIRVRRAQRTAQRARRRVARAVVRALRAGMGGGFGARLQRVLGDPDIAGAIGQLGGTAIAARAGR